MQRTFFQFPGVLARISGAVPVLFLETKQVYFGGHVGVVDDVQAVQHQTVGLGLVHYLVEKLLKAFGPQGKIIFLILQKIKPFAKGKCGRLQQAPIFQSARLVGFLKLQITFL